MEPSTWVSVRCHPANATTQSNTSSESASDLLVTSFLSCILATICVVGAVGNIYTLVVTTGSMRCTGSVYVYVVTLALADLLYLPTVPFLACTYFVRDWYFGDLGCRIPFSLDLLTVHASIFILTIMSTEQYLAIVRPLDTLRSLRDSGLAVTCLVWLVAFLLALPTMIFILHTSPRDRVTKPPTYQAYLTVLFSTYILTLGIIICWLYTKLARTCWRSQLALVLRVEETSRCPKQKVLCMIFSMVLAYWPCFLPFWLGQLFSISRYEQGDRGGTTVISINFLVTCLASSNGCLNPFLHTPLSTNHTDHLRSRHQAATSLPGPRRPPRPSPGSRGALERMGAPCERWVPVLHTGVPWGEAPLPGDTVLLPPVWGR